MIVNFAEQMSYQFKRYYLKGALSILILSIIAIHIEFARIVFDIRHLWDALDQEIDQFKVTPFPSLRHTVNSPITPHGAQLEG